MTPEARKARLEGVFSSDFDMEAMGRFVMGRYWKRATPSQREEYLDLFRSYVANIYATRFEVYSGQTFEVTREQPLSEGSHVVLGRINRSGEAPVRLAFYVEQRPEAGSYKIIDVHVEGISLLITKRDEFASILEREGVEGLISRLRQRAN